jgi:hypothetical protein
MIIYNFDSFKEIISKGEEHAFIDNYHHIIAPVNEFAFSV